MKGWFDAFRDDGAPTLYSFSNRTPVTGDVSIVAITVLFATLYVAFLVIFPGVRKQVRSNAFVTTYFRRNFSHSNYEIASNNFSK
jgi:dual oxidase maturation factor 1